MKILIRCFECGSLIAFYKSYKVKLLKIRGKVPTETIIRLCNDCIKKAGYKGRKNVS